jgi:signal transduction histidine kinase
MKIRIRLSMWYFTVSFLILSILSIGIYWGMHRVLHRTVDEDLEIFTDMIESSYNPVLGEFEEILWKLESAKRFQEVYLIVYNNNVMIKFASPMTQFVDFNMPLPKDDIALGFTRTTKLIRPISVLKPDDEGNVTFRGISRRMFYNNHPIGWIKAGLPITDVENALDKLFNVIIIVNILAVLLVGIGGFFIIGRFLVPIKTITNKAKIISHSNLNERIEVHNEQDELGQLTITLNNLLERLYQAFETQRRFMADAAHELKTPLSVLRAHWEDEIDNPELNNDFKERLVQDIETIGRLNQMINKFLFLAQTEDVYDKMDLSKIQLDEFLTDIINDAKILAELKEQSIDIVELTPLVIEGDTNQLYQLFFNLIDNAIKYTPQKGKIWLSLRKMEQNAQIQIRDNGVGIDENELSNIFNRFYRVDKDRSRKTGGSGLGLAICKMIVDSHHGKIIVDSRISKGSTFTVLLPLSQSI